MADSGEGPARRDATHDLLRGLSRLLLLGLLLAGPTGCATRTWNTRIKPVGVEDRYEFGTRFPHAIRDTFVVLAFSGGGTRAAAFSYGVLEKLRDTEVMAGGQRTPLLNLVDVITSVSGGSYTAAYYGLFGDRIFRDFRFRFLYRDWQGELLGLLWRPDHLLSIAGRHYSRSDLMAAYLDRTLLEGKTFADMSPAGLPMIILNASDLNNATTFSFIQQQFDFLCSDLSTYPVANAVMASAAVPGPFAPIALRNYPDCPQRHQSWVTESLAHDDMLDRRYAVARALSRYDDPQQMPILRLVDGGVTDNLGVRGSMMSPVAQYGDVPNMAGAFTPEQLHRVRHVLVIVANAQVYAPYAWSVEGRAPGLINTVRASFDASLGILNTETVSLAKNGFLMWARHVSAMRPPGEPGVKVDFAVLTFNQIADPAERQRFNAMPTAFHLRSAQVDALRALAGQLLGESPEFQSFLRDMRRDEH
ncbi:patatin [Rhodanobacter sp. FW510-R12]|uniref:patatin-like phospholipase family protein n=1 Tax=unclassified Rhodanobacter TaxID=2621553 RepID=UPI0007AA2D0E|nr:MULTISPECIES: patatin-like phospholipase family protein [unclassified Rhodanobacter]KZC16585.1 patatin [Rhodanobacter sp. FW104-R8]KZC27553.1 patatin [Rhodanobacter sp. FW510-T8]KZC31805.1 patatin [Rhodanobacter sp. FW510-R10]